MYSEHSKWYTVFESEYYILNLNILDNQLLKLGT